MKKDTFGGRVQERREELHYTQEALAEVLGLSYNFIVALEGDRKKTSIQTFTKLISVLDVSADWLLGIEPSEHRKEREERFKYIDEKIGDLSITAQDRILTVIETMINYETRMETRRLEN